MPNDRSWLQRITERITGRSFASRDDPRDIECRPLVVLDGQGNVVYSGNATIEFTPNWVGVGSLRVISPTGLFPDISAERYNPVRSGDQARTPVGATFSGRDADDNAYSWLIDRSAVNYMRRKVSERWAPGWESAEQQPERPKESSAPDEEAPDPEPSRSFPNSDD